MTMKNRSSDSQVLSLVKELISKKSITPLDDGCQKLIADRLNKFGFKVTNLKFNEVTNTWLRIGHSDPLVVFAGHTDVVPPGPLEKWDSDPFEGAIKDGRLRGRGASDMKSSIAAFVIAIENYLASNKPLDKGSIALLLTSDEEGPATNGTKKVVEWLRDRQEYPTFCVVGEPTSSKKLGDTIKNGRRGSISGDLTIIGRQGHVAYPDLAKNPIHSLGLIVKDLTEIEWDKGNKFFPPTSFQISNIAGGTGATNIIPGTAKILFNLRFSPEITIDEIKQNIRNICENHKLEFRLKWNISGLPFLTHSGDIVNIVQDRIRRITGITPNLSTSGGTSDARFISSICDQVIEFGPVNKTIHQVNEEIRTEDLENLVFIYQEILSGLLDVKTLL